MLNTFRGINNRAATALMLCALGTAVHAQGPTPVGKWRTIDDKTGKAKSIVEIKDYGGELRGTVLSVFSPPSPSPDPKCEKCSGDLKGKPIIGMTILWGLRKDGDEYSGGRVLDPEEGKTYKGKVHVIDGGRKLELRGYIGISLIGRSQTWVREN